MSANLKSYAAAVATLRLSCRLQRELSEAEQRAQASLYAQALSAYHPGDVREACEDWVSRVKWWPELADLLSLVREKQAIREAAARPKLPPPPDRRPPPAASDHDLLEQWRRNDALYHQMLASPDTWDSNRRTLQHVYETIQQRRWKQRPDLANRYYALAEEPAAE